MMSGSSDLGFCTVEQVLPAGVLRIEMTTQVITWEDASDEHWSWSDAAGHLHCYVKPAQPGERWRKDRRRKDRPTHYPTLRLIVDRRWRCSGLSAYGSDPHWVEDSHYECIRCGERVTPGHGPGAKSIPVSRSIYLNDELITKPVAEALLSAYWTERNSEPTTVYL
jgi:hypothetical protein